MNVYSEQGLLIGHFGKRRVTNSFGELLYWWDTDDEVFAVDKIPVLEKPVSRSVGKLIDGRAVDFDGNLIFSNRRPD